MSYQPDPPAGGKPTSPFGVRSAPPPPPTGPRPPSPLPYSYGAVPAGVGAARGTRRKGLLFTGVAIALLGLGAAVVLAVLSGSAKEETVKRFARAPVGCTTTLEFEKSATFTLYIETSGKIGSVDGDCAATDTTYHRGDGDVPRVSLTLVNSTDQATALTPTDAPKYAVADFVGRGYQRVDITEPGTYRLTVTSDDTDFAIAVGGKPDADANVLRLAGVGAATLGLLLGGGLILLGLRRRKPAPANLPAGMWPPTPAGGPGWYLQATVPAASPAYPVTAPTPIGEPTPGAPPSGWGPPR